MDQKLTKDQDLSRVYPGIFSPRFVVFNRFRKILLSLIQRIVNEKGKKSLLDFGCGDMPYKELLSPSVTQYIGVDLKENKKADFYIDFDSKTSLDSESVDLILSTYVLEHVDNPVGYLSEANRLLKKGGNIILSTHGVWLYHPTPNDYWRWTSTGLRKIIEEEGFEIIHFEGILGLSATGLQLFQDGILFKLPSWLKGIWSFLLQRIIWLMDKIHTQAQRDRDGAMYVVLAKKI